MSIPLGEKASINAEDDVRAAYDELKAKSEAEATEEPTEEPEASEEPSEAEEPESSEEPREVSTDDAQGEEPEGKEEKKEKDDIPPPSDWTAEAKEWFRKQPATYKQETARLASQFGKWRHNQHGQIDNLRKQIEAERADVEEAAKVIRRWLPRWNAAGETEWSAIAKLCAFNEKIIKDPDAAIDEIARISGRKVQIEGRKAQAQGSEQIDYTKIKEQVKAELNNDQRVYQQQANTHHVAAQVGDALDRLTSEVNDSGKYIYPDLHSEAFQQELEPIAAAIWRHNPGLDAKEMLVRAYKANNGRIVPRKNGSTSNLVSSRNNAAKKAASSISGNLSTSKEAYEPLPNETVEQSIERAMRQLTQR